MSRWLHLARHVYANLPFSYTTKTKIREALSPVLRALTSEKSGLAMFSELRKSFGSRSDSLAWPEPDEHAFVQLLLELSEHCSRYGPIGNMITVPFISSGGAERVALNFARAYRELQPCLTVLVLITDRPLKNDLMVLPDGIKVVALHDHVQSDFENIRLQFLKSLVQAVKPAVLHNINSELAWKLIIDHGLLMSRLTQVFASIFAFQYLPGTRRKTGYASYFLRPALPHLHGLLSDNHRFITDTIAEYELDATTSTKLHVVYNPCRIFPEKTLNAPSVSSSSCGPDGPDRRLRVLWAGRLDAEKRVDLLYDIARRCVFADFMVYGHSVVDKETSLPSQPNLILKGGFSDPRELVRDGPFDAFLFTSRWEGLPNILLEVGALGIPVIAPTVGGVGELISTRTGFPLPEEPTVRDYEEALQIIRADAGEAATRAQALKELVKTRHSWGAFRESVQTIPGYINASNGFGRGNRVASDSGPENPVISIVIPFFNQGQYLYESVSSALLAYEGKTEIIVVDDGSTDPKTELYLGEVANLSGKVRIVRQVNQGLSGARNSGIEAATGQFIQLLDADDILIPGKLDVQVAHMAICPALDVSICDFLLSDETVTHITRSDAAISRFPLTLDDFLYRWERGFAIPIHCALFRKDVFSQTRFDVSARAKEDWLFWCTLSSLGCRLAYLRGHYAVYRQHAQSMRRSYVGMGKSWLLAAQKIDALLGGKHPLFLESAVSWFEQYYEKHPEYRQEVSRLQTNLSSAETSTPTRSDNQEANAAQLLRQLSFLSTTANSPFISVVIPVYNHYEYIEECLRSLAEQGTTEFEVICIDDASPDLRIHELMRGLKGKLTGLRIVMHASNRGISASQNEAVELARGKFIAFLDCDDLLVPNALSRVDEEIKQRPDIDYFFSDRWDIDEAGASVRLARYGGYYHLKPSNRSLREDLLDGMVASHLKVIRRSVFIQVNGCSDEFEGIQDWELALKISEIGRLAYIPEPLYKHRIHSHSVTESAKVDQMRKTNMLRRRYIDRWIRSAKCSVAETHPGPSQVFNCNSALPSLAELKKSRSSSQCCVLDLRGPVLTSSITFAREFNSYFDLILWDRPEVPAALMGYLWGDVLSPHNATRRSEVVSHSVKGDH
ncbi:glycosyltransferase [Nitrosospira sp. Is2]|uniref:glycosyltransferase n=1 Tax=Nitrosospira sp. Is2 TaxID=3080532 RepID=UPI00295332E9|nr:glycosyltransferase [Nitrosospira sp. Is2]WON72802.1 glycosyltransferase [Nitrosospira sp. Is2]